MELVILGLENQEHIHYAMPMRIMGYNKVTVGNKVKGNVVENISSKKRIDKIGKKTYNISKAMDIVKDVCF